MTSEVLEAVEEIKLAFPGHRVDVEPEAQGGAYVIVHDAPLGEIYTPSSGWIGFLITFQYPHSDVYPHFMGTEITRVDGRPHGEGIAQNGWRGCPAWQISRRSNHLDPAVDTAASKLAKVLQWLQTR